jgi:hypothetical protein
LVIINKKDDLTQKKCVKSLRISIKEMGQNE